MSAGGGHCLLMTGSRVLAFGDNSRGQTGTGTSEVILKPTQVLLSAEVKCISAGYDHSAVLVGESIYTFGAWNSGKLGHGQTIDQHTPAKVTKQIAGGQEGQSYRDFDVAFKQVACGGSHTCALAINGDLYGWGLSSTGQLGVTDEFQIFPRLTQVSDVAFVTCGLDHTAVVKTNGELMTFGTNNHGQLGRKSKASKPGTVRKVKCLSRPTKDKLGS